MSKLKTRILILLLFLSCWVNAQQLPMYSQYILNEFVLNPAIGGKYSHYELQASGRYQWAGISGAPRTVTVSLNIPHQPQKIGLGGYIFTDVTGPVSRTGINFAYARQVQLSNTIKLGMGVFGGILQYRIDGSDIKLADEEERYIIADLDYAIVPDATFGCQLYSEKFYIGFSTNQVFHNKLRSVTRWDEENYFGYFVNHLFITAGYKFQMGEKFDLEPLGFMKVTSTVPVQYDLGARIFYNNDIWVGSIWRSYDAVSALLGYEYKKMLYFGYSFDFAISNLKNYSQGSHEVVVGYRFGEKGL